MVFITNWEQWQVSNINKYLFVLVNSKVYYALLLFVIVVFSKIKLNWSTPQPLYEIRDQQGFGNVTSLSNISLKLEWSEIFDDIVVSRGRACTWKLVDATFFLSGDRYRVMPWSSKLLISTSLCTIFVNVWVALRHLYLTTNLRHFSASNFFYW